MQKRTFLNSLAILLCLVLPHYWPVPLFTYAPVCLGAVIWLLRSQGESLSSIGFEFKRFSWKTLPVGLAFAIGWLLTHHYLIQPLMSAVFGVKKADVCAFNFIKHNPIPYLLILLAAWLIGGWYEEIIFRGFIHSRIAGWLKGKKYAFMVSMLFTSTVFALYHIQQGAGGVLHAGIFALIPSYLMYRYKGNLWYGMVFHALYDTIALTLIFLDYHF